MTPFARGVAFETAVRAFVVDAEFCRFARRVGSRTFVHVETTIICVHPPRVASCAAFGPGFGTWAFASLVALGAQKHFLVSIRLIVAIRARVTELASVAIIAGALAVALLRPSTFALPIICTH